MTSSTNPSSHGGTTWSRSIRCWARILGRSGCRCQHAEHNPLIGWVVAAEHCPQVRDGFRPGLGREQVPHQPVASRMIPGRPHRGHGDFAAAAAVLRRHVLHKV